MLRVAAFQNPEFYKAQAMRLSTYNKPRVVACAEDLPHHIGLQRGCLDDIRKMLTDLGVRLAIHDERHDGTRLEVKFQGELRREQKTAAAAMTVATQLSLDLTAVLPKFPRPGQDLR